MILEVRCSRKFSAFFVIAGTLVFGMCAFALPRVGSGAPFFVKPLIYLLLPAMLWGVVVGIRRLIHPPLMFRADENGIRHFYRSSNNSYSDSGVLIPWDLVQSIELEKVRVTSSDSSGISWVIACRLGASAPFKVEDHSVLMGRNLPPDVVYLDAFTGTVTKQELASQLKTVWQHAIR